ncbi:sortase A [Actinacidiphila rubida]|uniref:Sortase A n=2 Tax=Actinacidiphila rubida TaxID=310780 RepID=A0A1H8GLF8_9ACTN|nr:class E sortase [Actinacidiphila rubida]SEN44138.1 sortase A [Actinacidiphila rubida]
MTTLRPERPADGPMSYDDTGQFKAVVEQLDDPLNDPLPGRPPAAPEHAAARPGTGQQATPPTEAPPAPADAATDAQPADGRTSPWFRTPAPDRPQPAPAATPYARPAQPAAPPTPYAEPRQEAQPAEAYAQPQSPQQPQAQPPRPPRPVTAATPYGEAYSEPQAETTTAFGTLTDPGAEATAVFEAFTEPQHPQGPQQPPDRPQARPDPAEPDSAEEEPPGAAAPAPPPADGGRAARRKAARQGGGGHRARARTGAPAAAEAAAQPSSAPLSRVEARRAAKAAKDSPAVVISRVVGELFITAGVVMLLFVTYQLWWTNVRAHEQANSASNHLEQQWATGSQDPNRAPGAFQPGQGFAIMYIPKLDVKAPIAQGVSKTKVLDHGMIGHYDGSLNTAMPWDKTGNFAVAAHRNTHGEPFRYINHLVPGDKVVVETATTYYTYQVTSSLASTPPTNTSVLQPVPVGSGFTTPGRYLTLTTCTPEFTSENRLIVWGKLIEERPRSKGKPDALLSKG